MADTQSHTQTQTSDHAFQILSIYVKDLSFESPNVPQIFMEKSKLEVQGSPNLDVNIATIDTDTYEVVLKVSIQAKANTKTAFIVEAAYAGVFKLSGFKEAELGHALGAYCPEILFPYAREVISDAIVRGGFPQLLLAPVSFDALYRNKLAQQDETKVH